MAAGRRRVDTQGGIGRGVGGGGGGGGSWLEERGRGLLKDLEALFFNIYPKIGTWSICKAQSILFNVTHEISWSGTILY